jgi:hypothetical protein
MIFSIFGGYWAFLEARFLEEVGDVEPTPMLYKPGLFEAKGESFMLIFQNPNPVSVSLIFQSNLNAKLSFSTVSAYATAVFQHLLTAVFQHQHMLQPGVSASAHSGVSASAYATAWCFSIYSALCFSLCYSLVFQHKLQRCFSI